MKLKLSCANKVVACSAALFALAWAANLSAQTAKQGKATVTALKGSARYTVDNRTWQVVKVGTVIRPGSVIQTAANSYVDIVIGERVADAQSGAQPVTSSLVRVPGADEEANIIRITPDSILAVDKLTAEDTGTDIVTETQLDLRAGRITGSVKKLAAASRYEIKFPTGVAGIRGTLYSITAGGVVQVGLGSVVVSYLKDGVVVTQVVVGGQQFDPATGLVTPIPNFNLPSFLREIPKPPRTRGTTFVQDNTIYYVSPISGGGRTGG